MTNLFVTITTKVATPILLLGLLVSQVSAQEAAPVFCRL